MVMTASCGATVAARRALCQRGGMNVQDMQTWLAGVDGCAGGWLAAFVRPAGGEVRLRVLPRFAEVLAAPEAPAIISVDMPIGLPAQVGIGGRAAERAVRPLLGA